MTNPLQALTSSVISPSAQRSSSRGGAGGDAFGALLTGALTDRAPRAERRSPDPVRPDPVRPGRERSENRPVDRSGDRPDDVSVTDETATETPTATLTQAPLQLAEALRGAQAVLDAAALAANGVPAQDGDATAMLTEAEQAAALLAAAGTADGTSDAAAGTSTPGTPAPGALVPGAVAATAVGTEAVTELTAQVVAAQVTADDAAQPVALTSNGQPTALATGPQIDAEPTAARTDAATTSDASVVTGDGSALPSGTETRAAEAALAPAAAATPASNTGSGSGVDVSALTPVAASGPAAPSTAGPLSADAQAVRATQSPVAEQVGPAVARLVSRGDGTHRMTITLTPEHLGDVRVTLTVRHGEVSVTFGAADEARRALLESAPELRRLLELAGATSTHVDVDEFDRSGQGRSFGADQGLGDGSHSPGGEPANQDHHARTRGGMHATDGTPSGTGNARPLDLTSSRPSGIDMKV